MRLLLYVVLFYTVYSCNQSFDQKKAEDFKPENLRINSEDTLDVKMAEHKSLDTSLVIISENDPPKADTMNNKFNFYGIWRVVEYKSVSISAINNEQARNYINKLVLLDEDYAKIFTNYCSKPKYEIKKHDTKVFLHDMYKVNPKDLDIKHDSLSVVSFQCKETPYDLLLIDDKVMINIDGVFLILEKTKE